MTTSNAGRPPMVDPLDVELPADMSLTSLGDSMEYRQNVATSTNMQRFGDWAARRETPDTRWPDAGTAGGAGSAEFEDLATVRRFAEQVCALGDGSDFTKTIEACSGLKDMVRDLGGDMNQAAVALVDAAVAVARDGEALKEQATQVAALAQDMSGDGG